MSATTDYVRREFSFNGQSLGDPAPSQSPEQVRQLLTAQFPALTNASIEGPTSQASGVQHYRFATRVGTKG
jgi:PRTRC genetic system protein C